MKNKRSYRSTEVYYQSNYTSNQIWDILTDPRLHVDFDRKPCYKVKTDTNFELKVGEKWSELHFGEDCSGDIVVNKIIKIEPYKIFKTHRNQAGISNTTLYTLAENESGTLICEKQSYGFSYRNFKLINFISWTLLVTGLLTRISFKPEDDLFWFENLEKLINKNTNLT